MHNNNDERDIIDQIDEVTQPGPDAMRWTPPATEPKPADDFSAMLLGMDRAEQVHLTAENADAKVTELVGDPRVTHLELVSGVDFWLGDDSLDTGRFNMGANYILRALLRDVAGGDYAASDSDREYAGELISGRVVPVLYGPCLVTGVNSDGTGPGPLSDAFLTWLERHFRELERRALTDRAEQLSRELGLPVEAIVIITD